MATTVVPQQTISTKLITRWEQVSDKLAALAEEISANKFDYKPAEHVRSFAEVLRHIAFWNRYVADSARGKKADDTANELPKKEFSTKAQILDALKRSAKDAAAALKESRSGLSPETTEMLISFIEHNCEHYGQLVVYARLNSIVPPASRG
jgi:uncharacterized damage-inducible protein DinB